MLLIFLQIYYQFALGHPRTHPRTHSQLFSFLQLFSVVTFKLSLWRFASRFQRSSARPHEKFFTGSASRATHNLTLFRQPICICTCIYIVIKVNLIAIIKAWAVAVQALILGSTFAFWQIICFNLSALSPALDEK